MSVLCFHFHASFSLLRETGLLWEMDRQKIFLRMSYDIDAHHWDWPSLETKKMEITTPDNFVKGKKSLRYVTWKTIYTVTQINSF